MFKVFKDKTITLPITIDAKDKIFVNVRFEGVKFEGTIDNTAFVNCSFIDCTFNRINRPQVPSNLVFYRCSFEHTVFSQCNLLAAKFISCNARPPKDGEIIHTFFSACYLGMADFTDTKGMSFFSCTMLDNIGTEYFIFDKSCLTDMGYKAPSVEEMQHKELSGEYSYFVFDVCFTPSCTTDARFVSPIFIEKPSIMWSGIEKMVIRNAIFVNELVIGADSANIEFDNCLFLNGFRLHDAIKNTNIKTENCLFYQAGTIREK